MVLGVYCISCGYKFIKLHFKTMLVGFKKNKNKKLNNNSETWIRQGLCHALITVRCVQ